MSATAAYPVDPNQAAGFERAKGRFAPISGGATLPAPYTPERARAYLTGSRSERAVPCGYTPAGDMVFVKIAADRAFLLTTKDDVGVAVPGLGLRRLDCATADEAVDAFCRLCATGPYAA